MKRVFCPKKECYDPEKNANLRYGKPLPSFRGSSTMEQFAR